MSKFKVTIYKRGATCQNFYGNDRENRHAGFSQVFEREVNRFVVIDGE